jgi:hypothetical protein
VLGRVLPREDCILEGIPSQAFLGGANAIDA